MATIPVTNADKDLQIPSVKAFLNAAIEKAIFFIRGGILRSPEDMDLYPHLFGKDPLDHRITQLKVIEKDAILRNVDKFYSGQNKISRKMKEEAIEELQDIMMFSAGFNPGIILRFKTLDSDHCPILESGIDIKSIPSDFVEMHSQSLNPANEHSIVEMFSSFTDQLYHAIKRLADEKPATILLYSPGAEPPDASSPDDNIFNGFSAYPQKYLSLDLSFAEDELFQPRSWKNIVPTLIPLGIKNIEDSIFNKDMFSFSRFKSRTDYLATALDRMVFQIITMLIKREVQHLNPSVDVPEEEWETLCNADLTLRCTTPDKEAPIFPFFTFRLSNQAEVSGKSIYTVQPKDILFFTENTFYTERRMPTEEGSSLKIDEDALSFSFTHFA